MSNEGQRAGPPHAPTAVITTTFKPTKVQEQGKKTKGDYRGNTLVHAGTLVEAGKYLEYDELDTRKQHRLDYVGRSSRAALTVLGCEGPKLEAIERFVIVKREASAGPS